MATERLPLTKFSSLPRSGEKNAVTAVCNRVFPFWRALGDSLRTARVRQDLAMPGNVMPKATRKSGRCLRDWVLVAVVIVVHVLIGGVGHGEDRPRVNHAFLGCSVAEADAIYGFPGQEQLVPPAAGGGVRTQRVYKTANGRMVEVWFGQAGAEAILLPGENDPEVIHQLLLDSAANAKWELDGRIWRRSDGAAVAAIMRQKAFFIGTAPWLVKAVEAEARNAK